MNEDWRPVLFETPLRLAQGPGIRSRTRRATDERGSNLGLWQRGAGIPVVTSRAPRTTSSKVRRRCGGLTPMLFEDLRKTDVICLQPVRRGQGPLVPKRSRGFSEDALGLTVQLAGNLHDRGHACIPATLLIVHTEILKPPLLK